MTGSAAWRKNTAMRAIAMASLMAATSVGSTIGCQADLPPPPGASSRPAYPPKKMANAYDVVAHVEDGVARRGSHQFQVVHEDGHYYFASQANRDKFKSNPDKYVPAFRGWCACTMAKGVRMKASGEHFEVQDGRLYLFHDADLQQKWMQDRTGMKKTAEDHWAAMR